MVKDLGSLLIKAITTKRGELPDNLAELQDLWKRLTLLRRGFVREGRTLDFWDDHFAVLDARSDAQGYISEIKDMGELKRKLRAEIGFYEGLFRIPPGKKYRIRLKKEHTWLDGITSSNVIVFECPPGKPLGYTHFFSEGREFRMAFFQGHKDSVVERIMRRQREGEPKEPDHVAANKILGRQWYEVFMDRVVEAYRPLQREGIAFKMRIPELGTEADSTGLYLRLRDRYFHKEEEVRDLGIHSLNHGKKRVQTALGKVRHVR